MTINKNYIVGAVLVVALAVIGGSLLSPKASPSQRVGSIAGPDIPFDHICVGGLCRYNYSSPALTSATNTPCQFQAPTGTSTLRFAGLNFTTSTSSATVWTISRATSMNATTSTIIATTSIAANAQGTLNVATTTTNSSAMAQAQLDLTFGSSTGQWLVFGVQGGQGNQWEASPVGSCYAEFTQYPF